MANPTLAVLDEDLPVRIKMRPEVLEGLEVVWSGSSLSALEAELSELRPQVLILNLELLGPDPAAKVRALVESSGASLALTLYAFAPREVVAQLTTSNARPLRAPVSLEILRAQMTSVIVRSIVGATATSVAKEPPPDRSRRRGELPLDGGPLRGPRFAPDVLARLGEMPSSVQCECPNHLAALISNLLAFERYAARCENKNEADAHIHRFLHRKTAYARYVLEDALERLMEHEGLDPDRL